MCTLSPGGPGLPGFPCGPGGPCVEMRKSETQSKGDQDQDHAFA